ncbi:hypothetical protein BDW59DRAFT_170621 [Aspergillus cavernicola]|uniref:FAD-binding PCMH-type domain-containing protein n=1 Tax=Aspergillus cavernicola TaxID=176166 RepID=A0ABR4IN81_9EURO
MGATTRYWLGLASAIALLSTGSQALITSCDDVRTELLSVLSEDANIYFPNDTLFDAATERWSQFYLPSFSVVVEVAEEEDVVKAVQYANSQDLPFLAINGGHGAISTLAKMDHGMEIWLHKLNSLVISKDGKTATFGGGITSADVIKLLWEDGKETADGELHDISKDSAESDLWWAMQGAGHNFGIVTSVTSKIYDVPDDGLWATEQLIFNHKEIEDLTALFNELADYQPPGFLIWTYVMRIPELDKEKPVVMAHFMQEGVSTIESGYIDPFRELAGDAEAVTVAGLYADIPKWIGTELTGRGCSRGGAKARFPISFPRYNIEALREFFDAFAEGTAGSSPFNTSMVILEQYSVQGVQAIPEKSTAFPHRQDDLLVSPVINYDSTAGNETEIQAEKFGETLRQILRKGSESENELHAYINYAFGNEDPKSWYGYDSWRIKKLQELKRKYDPHGRFSIPPPIMSLVPVDSTLKVPPPDPVEEAPKVAITPCEGLPVRYYFEGGLRRVHPYHYTYNTHCKERWRNRELVDIFTSEFRDREPGYYRKALENGHICVNGKPASPNTILKNGEVVSHTLHRHEPPVTGNDVGIIHESDSLLVIDKPAGVPVHSTGRYHYNSVIEILRAKYGTQFSPRPCNRLDRLTSGVMFIGKTAKGAEMMTVKLKARTIQKEYVARVKGRFPDGIIVVDQPIMSVNPKVGLNRVRATGKEAKTKFRRLAYYPPGAGTGIGTQKSEKEKENPRPATPPPSYVNESEGYSIVHCLPQTGRTHQIRVHLQFLGHPISNDPIYSNRRVFGPDLGKNDSTDERDEEIIDQLMKMGRTELPETVSYRTHFTTPPILPPGTDSSVAEAIMSKEHEAAVEAYQKRKGERLSGQICDVCGTELYTDPGVHELGIFLHAVAYSDHLGEWKYRSKMPTWGFPPAGLDGPREVPGWEDVEEGEEVVFGDGKVPEIGGEDGELRDNVTALVEGVGLVDISTARQVKEQETASAGNAV